MVYQHNETRYHLDQVSKEYILHKEKNAPEIMLSEKKRDTELCNMGVYCALPIQSPLPFTEVRESSDLYLSGGVLME